VVNPSTAQARVVVDELIRGGVRDVVLCPGSRNAPLAFALQDTSQSGWRWPRAPRCALR
jgi:2-succinyl-5-enolpyruvyl-6-hydroxy-3-cyclohexene-1-carboxylate synthase